MDGSLETDRGRLVDVKAGTVKAAVRDYRTGYRGNTNQSNSHNATYNTVPGSSSRLGQGRSRNWSSTSKMNGHVVQSDRNSNFLMRSASQDPDGNHLVWQGDTKEVLRAPPSDYVDSRQGRHGGKYFRSHSADRHRSGSGSRAPSERSYVQNGGTSKARVSRPVERIYLPTGGAEQNYYVIHTNGKQKQAHSVIGAPRYEMKNKRR